MYKDSQLQNKHLLYCSVIGGNERKSFHMNEQGYTERG